MNNVITIDMEEWFHICGADIHPKAFSCGHVQGNVERFLELFSRFNVKCTFFVLGAVAEELPSLVPMIADAGHEIASHGYSHRMVSQLDPVTFREEIRQAGAIIESQAGYRPLGFRAPQWSITPSTDWALQILKEEGYLYDSSMNPLLFIGDKHGRRVPHEVDTEAGALLEFPPMVTPFPFSNLPTGGGWGFRIFPISLIKHTIKRLNQSGEPAILYFHPREMEASGPRLNLSPLKSFAAYGPRTDVSIRLQSLLESFSFEPLRQLVEHWTTV